MLCGTSRLASALLEGRGAEAFLLNPLIFLILFGLVATSVACACTFSVSGLPGLRMPNVRIRRAILGLLFLACVANWVYLVIRGI